MEPGKSVAETAIEDQIYKVFPNDLNSHGTVFGGAVMAVLDRTAAVVAERHSERLCVTALVDSMHFLASAGQGDTLVIKAALNRVWQTSMEVGVKVWVENYQTQKHAHILSAYFTFVAVDEQHRPVPVMPVRPETAVEKRRFEEADLRREQRRLEARQRRLRQGLT